MIDVLAPAKINLGLEILGRRPDGFHEIRSILVKVSLFDRVTVAPARAASIWSDDPELSNTDNLAFRAARLLGRPVSIQIRKRIPAASGLGGASSDAAAVLRGISLLSPDIDAMSVNQAARELGSDVPFFLGDRAALASGRGERCTPLAGRLPSWFVIATPAIEIPAKTATLYRSLRPDDFTTGERVERLARALAAGQSLEPALLGNAFERPLHQNWPAARDVRDAMRESGARTVALSGAGPAHYAICDDFQSASAFSARLRRVVAPTTRIVVCRAVSGAAWRQSAGTLRTEQREPAAMND